MISRVTHRLIQWAARPQLPQRTIRLRLTAVYGVLFLVCGAALLAITYVLVEHATAGNYAYTGPNGISLAGKVGESPPPSGAQSTGRLQTGDGRTQTLTPSRCRHWIANCGPLPRTSTHT
jgi:hypothetical protein